MNIPPISRYFSEKSDFQCQHGIPFDSECVDCNKPKKHPLKNEASKHYKMWENMEVIELIEHVLTKEELIGACKFNILKYRLRIGNKDDSSKELAKIKDYENYLKFLENSNVEK